MLLVLDEGDPRRRRHDGDRRRGVRRHAGRRPLDDGLVEHWLGHRNDVAPSPRWSQRGLVVDTMEVAARWSALPGIYAEAVAALRPLAGMLAASAHQTHAYPDGACLYFTSGRPRPGPPAGPRPTRSTGRPGTPVTEVTLGRGGSLSHHHGVGLNRGRFMAEALGPGPPACCAPSRRALDPNGILNPGKLGLPSPWGPADRGRDHRLATRQAAGALADLGVLAPVVGVYTALHAHRRRSAATPG